MEKEINIKAKGFNRDVDKIIKLPINSPWGNCMYESFRFVIRKCEYKPIKTE